MKKTTYVLMALILFATIPLFAQTWSSFERLTWNSRVSLHPSVASDTGTGIHVVWHDLTLWNSDIYYKHSTDGGSNWSGLKRLTWKIGESLHPSIAVDTDNRIHVVWQDSKPGNFDIFYKHSKDGGATWSILKRLTWNSETSEAVSMATSGKKVYVVWQNGISPGKEIFFKSSSDGGDSWSGLKRLTLNKWDSLDPVTTVDSASGIHVVWSDKTPGNYEILTKYSIDDGVTWSGIKRISWNTGTSSQPSIATDSAKGIHLVWKDNSPGNYEIFYKNSKDRGLNWSRLTRLTWSSGISRHPSITVDSSDVIHVVWYDDFPGNDEIFYKSSTNGGATWSGLTRLTWNAGDSQAPNLGSDTSSGIHVVWNDDTPGIDEILYKNRK